MVVDLLRLTGHIDVAARGAAIVRQECALRWLSADQRTALSNTIYRRHERYLPHSAHTHAGLFSFERDAVERHFPPAPARILIGGIGSGREALALVQRGFTVGFGYDPSPELLARCRNNLARIGAAAVLEVGSHEQLAPEVPGAPYDACVLGWGSYTHVLGRAARVRLLRTLAQAAPAAPVLLSFLQRESESSPSGARVWERRVRLFLSHLPGRWVAEPGDAYSPATGFVHLFTREEIEHEARSSGYRVSQYDDIAYPHAVLVPNSPPIDEA